VLLVLSDGLPMALAAGFSLKITSDCLSCELTDAFPTLKPQLAGEANWQSTVRQVHRHKVKGLQATLGQSQPPTGLKPQEQQAWVAMASREQMQLFAPARYTEAFVVEQGQVTVALEAIGAKPAPLQQQNKNLIYRNIYRQTDSLQVIRGGRSEEFLYLRDKSAPTVFEYRLRTSAGVRVKTEGTTVAFRDSQGRGVRIDSPYLVDQSGQRNASAVKWQVLDGGQKLRLVVTPQGLRYPLVVDPGWTSLGMITARSYHTATLLANGKVLVTGGQDNTLKYLRSAELYDPVTGTWSSTGAMSTVRASHTATLLPNGKVLVAGGYYTCCSAPVGVELGSNYYYLSSAEIYDPTTGSWSNTGSMSTARYSHTATLLTNGKVLVAGGSGNFAGGPGSSAELYDPGTGTWSTTGSMNASRSGHTATLLTNGNVLVAGGSGLSSAEVYDPAIGSWRNTGSMNAGRSGHTATLLTNGNVLVAGGSGTSAEIYNPTTGTWSNTGSMNASRSGHTATLLTNGNVLVAGGSGLSSAEIYDPAMGSWTSTGSLSTARANHTATLLSNGKVLIAGGFTGSNGYYSYLSSAEVYDPATSTWNSLGMTMGRAFHTATLLRNGKVLVAGGFGSIGSLSSAEVYDPATGIWSSTNSMNTARQNHTATLLPNGKVLVAGGHRFINISFSYLNSAELYDPATGSWSTTSSMSTPRQDHTATLLPNGKVLVAGGYTSTSPYYLSSVEIYDPATGSWSTTSSMSMARSSYTATLLPNGKVLIAGGSTSTSPYYLSSAEIYDPATGTWSTTGSMSTARSYHTATLLPNGKVLVAGGGLNSTELYDPATGTWSNTGSMSMARSSHTATLLPNGKVLVAGGSGLSSAEIYDPAMGIWSSTDWMNTARSSHTATLLRNGKVLVAGGSNRINNSIDFYLSNAELYDPGVPVISFTPTSGLPGTTVVITGANFIGATAVLFNGLPATSFSIDSATQITAIVPTGATSGQISVLTPGGTFTSASSFTVIWVTPLSISGFTPARANFGASVIITGTSFTGASSVKFNGLSAAFTVNSDSQITATVPAGAISGLIQVITSNGSVTSTKFTVNPVAVRTLSWQQSGTGDFNGDGKLDLLWRNYATGVNRVWFMNGTAFLGQADFTSVTDTNWQLVGAADFTHDGKPDLVWRNFSTGQNAIWQMNGTTYVQSFDIGSVTDPNWQLAGIGDLTNDGNPDLIWRNYGTGDIYLWKMDGYTYQQAFFMSNVSDPLWQMTGVGDFTGDGNNDLIWRYWGGTGDVYLWQMLGYTYQNAFFMDLVADLNYQLTGVGDFTGDGQLDLVWTNKSSGDNYVWRMNGYTYQQSLFIGPTPTN